jgi:hypothetical protein
MENNLREVLRIEPDGAVFVFGQHAGKNKDLFDYMVTNVTGRTPHTPGPFDIKISPPPLRPLPEKPGELRIRESECSGIKFLLDGKPWLELQHDHVNVMGQREDNPVRVFCGLVEWMHAAKTIRARQA